MATERMRAKIFITEPYEWVRLNELDKKKALFGLTDEEAEERWEILTGRDPIFEITANVNLTTTDKKPVVGAELSTTIRGKEQIVKTDAKGMAILKINGPVAVIKAKKEGYNDIVSTIRVN